MPARLQVVSVFRRANSDAARRADSLARSEPGTRPSSLPRESVFSMSRVRVRGMGLCRRLRVGNTRSGDEQH